MFLFITMLPFLQALIQLNYYYLQQFISISNIVNNIADLPLVIFRSASKLVIRSELVYCSRARSVRSRCSDGSSSLIRSASFRNCTSSTAISLFYAGILDYAPTSVCSNCANPDLWMALCNSATIPFWLWHSSSSSAINSFYSSTLNINFKYSHTILF
jgi:hypothetical protein